MRMVQWTNYRVVYAEHALIETISVFDQVTPKEPVHYTIPSWRVSYNVVHIGAAVGAAMSSPPHKFSVELVPLQQQRHHQAPDDPQAARLLSRRPSCAVGNPTTMNHKTADTHPTSSSYMAIVRLQLQESCAPQTSHSHRHLQWPTPSKAAMRQLASTPAHYHSSLLASSSLALQLTSTPAHLTNHHVVRRGVVVQLLVPLLHHATLQRQAGKSEN